MWNDIVSVILIGITYKIVELLKNYCFEIIEDFLKLL